MKILNLKAAFAAFLIFGFFSTSGFGKPIQIELSTKGNDITFSQNTIQVQMESLMELLFSNKAEADSEIIHNVAIIKGELDNYIKAMQEYGYDLDKLRKHKQTIALSDGIAPGKSVKVSFKVEKPGLYHYVCTMPGHGDLLGMVGKMLVVEKK